MQIMQKCTKSNIKNVILNKKDHIVPKRMNGIVQIHTHTTKKTENIILPQLI